MNPRPVILAVTRNRRNQELVAKLLDHEGYDVLSAFTLQAFDTALERSERIDIALVDVSGFDRTIVHRCERLRAAGVPFCVVSDQSGGLAHREGSACGARALLMKPLVKSDLLRLIHTLLDES